MSAHLLRRPTLAPYFHPLFLISQITLPLPEEVIKIYFLPPLKRGDWGGPSYDSYYFGRYSSELAQLVPLPFSGERSTHYYDGLYNFLSTIRYGTRMSISTVALLTQLDSGILWL